MELCIEINKKSSLATKFSRIALDLGMHSSFEQTLEIEAAHLLSCVCSKEQQALVAQKLNKMKK
jgi:hypothetical protein